LVGIVLNKIISDKVERAILVFPFWKAQTWFPLILSNMISFPVRLPRHLDLLTFKDGSVHPLAKKLNMVAIVLSGNPLSVKDFQRRLLVLSSNLGEKELKNNMVWPGINVMFGTFLDVQIPFKQLKVF
jgi:hypothetical protein